MWTKHSFFSYLFIVGIHLDGYGQNPSPAQPPTIVLPSPNVAALKKFGDIPVSPYTGVPNISIPIYEIKSGDILVPVSVAYHAGGIKVSDEASRVGLGWALQAGGVISRTIIGKDDFIQGSLGYFNSSLQNIGNDLKGNKGATFNIQGCNITVGPGNNFDADLDNGVNFQPDVYDYNFLGYSGKFMLKRNRDVVLSKKEKISITSLDALGNAWEIKTPDGMKYLFEESESYQDNNNGNGNYSTSAWYLTKIISPKGFQVTLQYVTAATFLSPAGSYFESNNPHAFGPFSATFDPVLQATLGREYKTVYLDKIIFDHGELRFKYGTNREDIRDDLKIDSIVCYGGSNKIREWSFTYGYLVGSGDVDFNDGGTADRRTKRLKLESIVEKDGNGNSLPGHIFTYNNETASSSTLPSKASFARDHWGYYNGKTSNTSLIPNYILNYAGGVVSYYLGIMGEERNTDPTYAQLFSLKEIKYPTGGRTVFEYESHDFDLTKSKVNDFSYFKDYKEVIQKEIRKTYSGGVYQEQPLAGQASNYILDLNDLITDPTGPTYTTSPVELEAFFRFDGSVTSTCLPSSSVYVTLTKEDGTVISGPADVAFFIGQTSAPMTTCTFNGNNYIGATFKNTYNLTPGKYLWKVHLTDASSLGYIEDIHLKVNYYADKGQQPIVNSGHTLVDADFAGGLRIKRILDYDEINNTTPKIKRYLYHYTDTLGKIRSFGRRMARPIYSYFNEQLLGITVNGTLELWHLQYTMRESDSNIPLNGSAGGGVVGYDEVTILAGENGEFGKSVYQFENKPDIILDYSSFNNDPNFTPPFNERTPRKPPHLSTIPIDGNGNVLRQTEYAYSGGAFTRITEQENVYNDFVGPSSATWYGIDRRLIAVQTGTQHCSWFKHFIYPTLTEGRKLLTTTITKTYDKSNTALELSQTVNYVYDHSSHLQLTSTTTTDSKGRLKTSTRKYPLDYDDQQDDNAIELMKGSLYMHSLPVLEQRSITDGSVNKVTNLNIFKYGLNTTANTVLPLEVATLNTTSPVTESSLPVYLPSSNTYPAGVTAKVKFNAYDAKGNIAEVNKTDDINVSYIWDYKKNFPIAEVKNAFTNSIAYTSFESDGTGNWNILSSTRDNTTSITGTVSYNLGNGNISKDGLTNAKTYIVSYWSTNGQKAISGTQLTRGGYSVTINGQAWNYFEHEVTGVSTITVSGSGLMDELRLFPKEAQMTTYTYNPLIGMTSQCDLNNKITYYEYDGFGRLKLIRDQDRKILKTFTYIYQEQQ